MKNEDKKLTIELHHALLKKFGRKNKLGKHSQTYLTYALLVRGTRLRTTEGPERGLGMRLPNKIHLLRKEGVPIQQKVCDEFTKENEYWIKAEDLAIFESSS